MYGGRRGAGVMLTGRAMRPALLPTLALLMALTPLVVVAAQTDSAAGSGSDVGSDADADGGEDSGSDSGDDALVNAMASGDAVLVFRQKKFWSTDQSGKMCKQRPFVLSKTGSSNSNCLPAYNAKALSCTCLESFKKAALTWEFNVAYKSGAKGKPVKKVTSTSFLEVDKIAPFFLAQNVVEIRIKGQGPALENIEFLPDFDNGGGESNPKLETAKSTKSSLASVHIENIDMAGMLKYQGFFRQSLTNLTLKNCNLTDDSTAFLKLLSSITAVNLQDNKLTKIPSELLLGGLVRNINLEGNPIKSVALDARQYETVKALSTFKIDTNTLSTGSCDGGSLKQAQNVTFCVSNGSQADKTTTVTEASHSSDTNKFLIVGVIGGCLIVALLLFLFVRRQSSRQKEEAFIKHSASNSIFEDTISFDQSGSQQSMNTALLNDPIIITHRLPYNDVKVATCISRGGFGLVYSGTFNRRRVAIKKIRPELAGDIKHIEAFLKEICLMASLSHPRIVEFVGVSWDSLRNLSAVTEFMERGDLRDVLHSAKERNVRLSWESHKARIAMHVAEALTYLHSLSPKVIHRDLKSKNVLLDNEMTAKLSDFGVSRERRFEETHMTAGIGTAFWIAPEVLLGMDYDERADIFSFGVVLSELDTDDYPYWNAKNPAEGGKQQENVILRMVATGALRPEFSATCPESVLKLAGACLDVDPEKRPTAAQIVYTLQQLIRASPLTPQSTFSTL